MMMESTTTETPKAPDKRWYVIHTYSGYENKVKANLEHRIEERDVDAHGGADHKDKHGQVANLLARRPGDLSELGDRFLDVPPDPLNHDRIRSSGLGGGRRDRTRTYNRWFWRPVLCQLSYTPAVRPYFASR